MIRTWIADITPLYEAECYGHFYRGLPQFRKDKADRLKFQKDRAQSVGVWALLERVRERHGTAETAVFNLSHSGDYVICSVDMEGKGRGIRVGCDIEKVGIADLRLARRFFCRAEYEDIEQQRTPEEKNERFYRYWVLKEAFMKATRRGMALEMSSFEICLGDPPVLCVQPEEFPEKFYYQEYYLEEIPYRIAVCSDSPFIDSKIQMERLTCQE